MYFYVITKISNLNAQTQKYLYLAPLEKNLQRFSYYNLTDCIFGGGIEKLRKMPGRHFIKVIFREHLIFDSLKFICQTFSQCFFFIFCSIWLCNDKVREGVQSWLGVQIWRGFKFWCKYSAVNWGKCGDQSTLQFACRG